MAKHSPVNKLIMEEMKRQGLRPPDLARSLHISNTSIYHLLRQSTIQVDRLWQISKILNFNFFEIFADEMVIKNNEASIVDPEKEALKAENKTLKEVIKLFARE